MWQKKKTKKEDVLSDELVEDASRNDSVGRSVFSVDTSTSVALKDKLHRLVEPTVVCVSGMEDVVVRDINVAVGAVVVQTDHEQ